MTICLRFSPAFPVPFPLECIWGSPSPPTCSWARPNNVLWPMAWEEWRTTSGQRCWRAAVCAALCLLFSCSDDCDTGVRWRYPDIEAGTKAAVSGQLPCTIGIRTFVLLSPFFSQAGQSLDSDKTSSLLLFQPWGGKRSLMLFTLMFSFSWALPTSL